MTVDRTPSSGSGLGVLILLLLWLPFTAGADIDPRTLAEMDFQQHLQVPLPQGLTFRDSSGTPVTLGDYLGDRPLLLAPLYYDCPNLCGLTLEGIAEGLQALDLKAGEDFRVVLVSIDPREGPAVARARRTALAGRFPGAGVSDGWAFLTGEPQAIETLTRAIGFGYAYDEQLQQYAHTAGLVLATPDGTIARYLFGVRFRPRDLRLGLVESSRGQIGSPLDQVLLLCYDYNPRTGEYSLLVMNVLRLLGAVTLVLLGVFIGLMLLRERLGRAGGSIGES